MMTNDQSKNFANRLLVANDPKEVATIIEDIKSNHELVWLPLGDDQNNYSTVHNQAASPMAAFVELPVNSEDAQMFKFFEHRAPDSVDPMEYTSMKSAVESDWVDVDDAEVEIIADGLKPTEGNLLNLTVRDNGKGKDRETFGDFVGLSKPGLKKQKYGFCQGQYGMGSTGVMKYCGDTEAEYNEHCFKFIASASTEALSEWSWTLIRDNPHESQFEHLTIDGDFPIFDGTFGEALAEKFRENYSDKYDFEKNTSPPPAQEHGSFVKIYDYDTKCTRTNVSGYTGFRRKFERFIVDSPFPIRLTDIRYENNKIPHSETQGFLPTLRDGREHLLKDEEHIRVETDSESLGERDAHVLLFKSDKELEEVETTDRGKDNFVAGATKSKDAPEATGIQKDHAVMLTVNGQTHGSKSQFFLEQLGYSKVAEDTVVIVEFDDLANLGMVKMFQPSRDELTDSPQTRKFIAGLKDGLKNSDLLSEEEERRRASRGSQEEYVDTETLQEFIDRHPDITNWLVSGEKADVSYLRPIDKSLQGEGTPEEGETGDSDTTVDGDENGETGWEEGRGAKPPKLPTYLYPIKEYDPDGEHTYWDESEGYMPVKLPVNQPAKVRFETDAQNDYLARDVLSGSLNIWPSARFSSVELRNGILTLTIVPEENAATGDDFGLTVELTRPDPTECDLIENPIDAFPDGETTEEMTSDGGSVDTSPLTAAFSVEYVEAVEQHPSPINPSNDSENEDGDEGKDGGNGDLSTEEGEKEATPGDGEQDEERIPDLPNIERVYEEQWRVGDDEKPVDEEEYDPDIAKEFDAHTLLRVEPSQDGSISGLTLTINMDAAPLRRFIIEEDVKETWKMFTERQYELAVVFYAISQYRELYENYGESLEESRVMTTEIVEHVINGIGQTLMPTIIPEELLDRISD